MDEIARLEGIADQTLELDAREGMARSFHVFEQANLDAVQVALVTGRPLLVRGEPGTGKSQLARAVAERLGRALLPRVVDAHTETLDLLWTLDAMARLARAQVLGAQRDVSVDRTREIMAVSSFVKPGVLWWAFDWESAKRQAATAGAPVPPTPEGWTPDRGVVVLIDEIDKADTAVPNALLDAFGSGRFEVEGCAAVSVVAKPPLVIVTTNEERSLPDAFLRRCVVRHIALPDSEGELIAALVRKGKAHFASCDGDVLNEAAKALVKQRAMVQERDLMPPGVAEYLDLVRAVTRLAHTKADQLARIRRVARYVLDKHPSETQR